MTEKKTAKADNTKSYVAAEDTILEGRPVRKDAPFDVKGIDNERLQAYVDAGLLKDAAEDEDKETAELNKVLEEGANKIDTTRDKRLER